MLNSEAGEVYNILKRSLNAEMGSSYTPDQLMEMPNLWHVYSDVVASAEAQYSKDKKNKDG